MNAQSQAGECKQAELVDKAISPQFNEHGKVAFGLQIKREKIKNLR